MLYIPIFVIFHLLCRKSYSYKVKGILTYPLFPAGIIIEENKNQKVPMTEG